MKSVKEKKNDDTWDKMFDFLLNNSKEMKKKESKKDPDNQKNQ
jgi:hypothetical protein